VEAAEHTARMKPGIVVLAGRHEGPAGLRLELAAGMTEATGVPAVAEDVGLVLGLGSATAFCQLRKTFIPASKVGIHEQDPGEPLMYFDRALESRIGPQGLVWAYERVLGQGGGLVEAARRFARRYGSGR
jgi:hypothetical protein